jgi:hypothetical protein
MNRAPATVNSFSSAPDPGTTLKRSERSTDSAHFSGEKIISLGTSDEGTAIEADWSPADHDSQGFRSSFLTVINRYRNKRGVRWPYNSGVTVRLSKQEIQWAIDEYHALGKKHEIARLMAERMIIWAHRGKTQEEAAEFLGLSIREIKELDALITTERGPMSRMSYNPVPLERKRKWRPGVASAILRRKLSTKLKL